MVTIPKAFHQTYTNTQIADDLKQRISIPDNDKNHYAPFNTILVVNLDQSTNIKVFMDNDDEKFFIVPKSSAIGFQDLNYTEVNLQRIESNTIAASKVYVTVGTGISNRILLKAQGQLFGAAVQEGRFRG